MPKETDPSCLEIGPFARPDRKEGACSFSRRQATKEGELGVRQGRGGEPFSDELRTNALEINADRTSLRQRDEGERVGMRQIESDRRAFFRGQAPLAMRPIAESNPPRRAEVGAEGMPQDGARDAEAPAVFIEAKTLGSLSRSASGML
jgi:hypothetical protein